MWLGGKKKGDQEDDNSVELLGPKMVYFVLCRFILLRFLRLCLAIFALRFFFTDDMIYSYCVQTRIP